MKTIASLAAALLAATLGTARAGQYSDLWWNPQESGWGLNLVQQDETAFVTLFVYDAENRPTWYFAEGYTGTGFDEYLTFLNPNPTAAVVTMTYFLADGTTQLKQVQIGANARYTTAVHGTSEGVGPGQAVSAKVETTNAGGIVVERPMYFTYGTGIDGGHIVVGYAP